MKENAFYFSLKALFVFEVYRFLMSQNLSKFITLQSGKQTIAIHIPGIPKSKVKQTIKFNQLKVQSCKLYENKYVITPTQITNTEIFAFIAVLVFKLLSRKILFINRKDNRNC